MIRQLPRKADREPKINGLDQDLEKAERVLDPELREHEAASIERPSSRNSTKMATDSLMMKNGPQCELSLDRDVEYPEDNGKRVPAGHAQIAEEAEAEEIGPRPSNTISK